MLSQMCSQKYQSTTIVLAPLKFVIVTFPSIKFLNEALNYCVHCNFLQYVMNSKILHSLARPRRMFAHYDRGQYL